MSHQQYESTRGTAKEPTIEYSDSTRTSAAGADAYGDPKVYGSNPNPHNDTSEFGRDTHVNQDSIVKDRADGKDRLGNDPNTHSTLTGSSAAGNLSGTTTSVDPSTGSHSLGHQSAGQHGDGQHSSGGLLGGLQTAGAAGLANSNAQTARQGPIAGDGLGHAQHGHASHVHDDATCSTRPHGHAEHVHDDQTCETRPHGHPSHVHDNTCVDDTDRNKHHTTVADPNATGLAAGHGGSAAATGGKVPGAGTFDTEKKVHKEVFDGPEGGHLGAGRGVAATGATEGFHPSTTSSGAFGSADVGGSGMGTGVRSDYDKLGNRVGPGHKEGHTFVDENHGEKVGIMDKIKGKLGMNTGDDRHGDFTKDGAHLDQHGSTHAGGQGGAGRI